MTDHVTMAKVREHLPRARVQRATYLQAVAAAEVSVHDVIRAATAPGGRYLLRIRLNKLLAAQPGWGRLRSSATVAKVVRVAAKRISGNTEELDIAWLVDPRAGGRRLAAWANVVPDTHVRPWSGFPLASEPHTAGGGR